MSPENNVPIEDVDELRQKFWWNSRTGEVEEGKQSLSLERVGPFDTREEALRAPELLAERAKAWAEEEEND